MSAAAPFNGRDLLVPDVEDGARIEDPLWIEGRLFPAHEIELSRHPPARPDRALELADPVLTGDGSAEPQSAHDDVTDEPAAHVAIGLPYRQMDVAVAGVSAPDDQGRGGPGQISDPVR